MPFSIFCTNVPLPHDQTPNFSKLMPVVRNTREEAIAFSCNIIADNWIIWKIEGENNLLITRAEIEHEYFMRTGKHART